MKAFEDIRALQKVLINHLHFCLGKVSLKDDLIKKMEYPADLAELYASVLVTENDDNSANQFFENAYNLCGNWSKFGDFQSAGNYLRSSTETWYFGAHLKYEFRKASYEGYSNPFGGGFSRPSGGVERGVWVASNAASEVIKVLLIPTDANPYTVTVSFERRVNNDYKGCKINGTAFSKMES